MFAVLAAALTLSFGCKSSSDDDDGVTAPDMGSVTDIPSSGATAAPADATAAEELYTDASAALASALASNVSLSAITSVKARAMAARATDSGSEPISEEITLANGGTITLTGNYSWSETAPDEDFQPQPNKTYNDIWSSSVDGNVTGTITTAKVTYMGETYTISGKVVNTEAMYFNMDATTGSTAGDYTLNLDFGLQLTLGYAISVVRASDGVGAKFVLSYAADYAKDNINLTDDSDSGEAFASELTDYLESQPATLTVFNDANEPIFTAQLTAEEAFESSVLESID